MRPMKDSKVRLVNGYKRLFPFPLDIPHTIDCIQSILDFLDVRGEVEIKFSDDREMEGLNLEFLDVPGPTNVLSFPSDGEDFLGSLCVSLDTINREASLYEQDVYEYFFRMLIHGILHLVGYEHSDTMYDLTEKVFIFLKDNGCI